MAKRPTINTLTNTASPTYLTQLNQNFTNVQAQFDNTLSLDGSTPNAMNADIDLNGNDLINAGSVNTATLRIGGQVVVASDAVNQTVKKEFETVALLLADTGNYTNYAAGDYFRVVNGGFTYQVAASGASDHDVITAGGVKLYARPVAGVLNAASIAGSGGEVERLRIDASGNVGIGTSSPGAKLDVAGSIRGAAGGATLQVVDAGDLTLNASNAAGQIAFRTAGAERLRIDSSGNVGIGNTSPVVPLHVTGASMTTGVVYQNQPAQTSKGAAATLTIAELLTSIIQYTGAAANLTLPTGTAIEGGLPATFPTDMSFDFSVINTGSGTATIVTNTGITTVGGLTVAAGASGMFRVRKTAANTFTVYRIS